MTTQDFCIGMIVWGVIDPSNIFISSTTLPIIIGLGKDPPKITMRFIPDADGVLYTAFGSAGWAYGPAVISTNPARDFGK